MMIIREASELDYPDLRRIYLESRRNNFHWENAEELTLEDFDNDTNEDYVFLVEEDGKILGFAALYLANNIMMLV